MPFKLNQDRRHHVPMPEAQGYGLGRVCCSASARKLDGLVYGRGGCSLEGRASHNQRRAARVFLSGDLDGTKTRRSWRKLHIGLDADTGQIIAAALTAKEVDEGSEVGPLLDQMAVSVASFTGDGAFNQEDVSLAVAGGYREAAISRFKQVIGDGLRSRTDQRRTAEVDFGVYVLNRMLEPGHPISVPVA